MIATHVTNSLALLVTTEAALLQTSPGTVGALHYKPSVDRETQITRDKDVDVRADQNVKFERKSEVRLSNEYAKTANNS